MAYFSPSLLAYFSTVVNTSHVLATLGSLPSHSLRTDCAFSPVRTALQRVRLSRCRQPQAGVADQHRAAIDPALLGRLILVTTRAAILDQLAHGEPGDDAAFSRTLGRMLWLALHDAT